MFPEPRYNQLACDKCDAADAILAAYRHALKDVVRGKPEEAQQTAIKALDNDRQYMLGRTFHKIVKAGMILTRFWGDQESVDFKAAKEELTKAVEEVNRDPGATVRGWMGDKV